MTKVFTDWINIKRKICIEFDIDTKISYEAFGKCREAYMSQLTNEQAKDIMSPVDFLDTGEWERMTRINNAILQKIYCLFENDIEETFANGWRFYEKMGSFHGGIDCFPECERNEWIVHDEINWDLDMIKHSFIGNTIIDKEKCSNRYIPMFSSKMFSWLGKGENTEMRENVQFSQTLIKNWRDDYLLFMVLISRDPLYLAVVNQNSDIIVTDKYHLQKYLNHFALVQNISETLEYIDNEETLRLIESLRESYGKGNRDTIYEQLMNIIPHIYEELGKVDILLIGKDWLPNTLQVDIAWGNRDKDKAIKKKLGVETHNKLWKDGKTRIFRRKDNIQTWMGWTRKNRF